MVFLTHFWIKLIQFGLKCIQGSRVSAIFVQSYLKATRSTLCFELKCPQKFTLAFLTTHIAIFHLLIWQTSVCNWSRWTQTSLNLDLRRKSSVLTKSVHLLYINDPYRGKETRESAKSAKIGWSNQVMLVSTPSLNRGDLETSSHLKFPEDGDAALFIMWK